MAVIILAVLLTISISLNILTLLGAIGLVDDNNRLDGLNQGLQIENDRLKDNLDIFRRSNDDRERRSK